MARTQFKVKEGISIADDNSVAGYPLVPVGTVVPFAGSSAPEGWLLCDGRSTGILRTTYANLFAVIGTTYGVGDNSTTFNLPDAMGRTVIGAGAGSGLTSRTIAAQGGSESVTLTGAQSGIAGHGHSHTISASSGNASVDHSHNANHGHTGSSTPTDPSNGHAHSIPRASISQSGTNRLNVSNTPTDNSLATGTTSISHSHGVTVDANNFNTGGQSATHNHTITVSGSVTDVSSANASQSHENMMPFLVLNYIIKC